MSQAPHGTGEPTDGRHSTRERGETRAGGIAELANTSLGAEPYLEHSPQSPGQTVLTSADSSLSPGPPASATPGSDPQANGASLSRPAEIPQWPIKVDSNASRRRTNSPTGEGSAGKHTPPQRPPRPSHVTSSTDTPNSEDPTQVISAQQTPPVEMRYWEDGFQQHPPRKSSPPDPSRAPAALDALVPPSTNGTAMGNPRNPAATVTPTTRRPVNLGPPPSARRGAAAYYLPPTYVTPIPEELPETAHRSQNSFASSHVIPSSWGSSPPNLYVGEDPGEDEENEDVSVGDDGRESNGGDHDEASGLVRQASLGKRHKPALTTIKSSERLRKDGVILQGQVTTVDDPPREVDKKKPRLTTRTLHDAAGQGLSNGSRRFADDGLSGGTGLLDPSSSSDESLVKRSNASTTDLPSMSRSISPLATPIDPRIHQILGGLEKGGALEPRSAGFGLPGSTTHINGSLAGRQKHPKTSLYNGGEQESRNSLTSLPELIRRATRLASVLDRGRSTSRLGLFDPEESVDGMGKIHSRKSSKSEVHSRLLTFLPSDGS